jgi:hypothetical protein
MNLIRLSKFKSARFGAFEVPNPKTTKGYGPDIFRTFNLTRTFEVSGFGASKVPNRAELPRNPKNLRTSIF